MGDPLACLAQTGRPEKPQNRSCHFEAKREIFVLKEGTKGQRDKGAENGNIL